jgi:SAM-dependent methyltransferase
MRRPSEADAAGSHHALTENALLALSDDLPFKEESLDYIVALHMLEHIGDPIGLIKYWVRLLKPGGGIGIVVPDWRYTWDARGDDNPLGHKWNPTPDLVRTLYRDHWSAETDLESLDTYPYRISFDFVLRKHGDFVPFKVPPVDSLQSGLARQQAGTFLHGE